MEQMNDGIQEHINQVLSKYLFSQLDESILVRVSEDVKMTLFQSLDNSDLNELISVKVFQEDYSKVTLQPDNTFTLMYIHTGKIPPYMFMENKGINKNAFDWDGFRYSFVYDTKLDLDIPKIEEI